MFIPQLQCRNFCWRRRLRDDLFQTQVYQDLMTDLWGANSWNQFVIRRVAPALLKRKGKKHLHMHTLPAKIKFDHDIDLKNERNNNRRNILIHWKINLSSSHVSWFNFTLKTCSAILQCERPCDLWRSILKLDLIYVVVDSVRTICNEAVWGVMDVQCQIWYIHMWPFCEF